MDQKKRETSKVRNNTCKYEKNSQLHGSIYTYFKKTLNIVIISKLLIEEKIKLLRIGEILSINNFHKNEICSKCCMILTYLTCVISKVAVFFFKIIKKKTIESHIKKMRNKIIKIGIYLLKNHPNSHSLLINDNLWNVLLLTLIFCFFSRIIFSTTFSTSFRVCWAYWVWDWNVCIC